MKLTTKYIMMSEYHFARDSPFDGITAVRALAGLSLSDVDAAFIVTWMKFSQSMQMPTF